MIKRLWVKNYRSLADVNIALEPLTVLVGRNGAGKSNFVDVMRFVSEALQLGLDTAVSRRGGIHSIRRMLNQVEAISEQDIHIGLDIQIGDLLATYSFTLTAEPVENGGRLWKGQHRIKREFCRIRQSANPQEETGFETNDNQWVYQPEGINPPIQSNSLILPLTAGITPYKTVYDYLTGISLYTGFLAENIRQPQKPASSYPLDERGENLASVLRDLQKSKNPGFEQALRAIIPEIHHYKVGPIDGYLIIGLYHQTSENNGEQVFGLGDESDGTLRILTILAALYQEPPRSLIVIEEPELHIHPGALAPLWEEFEEAAARGQIVLTTHSPDLLDLCQAEQLRVVEKIEGITHIGPIEEPQKRMIQKRLIAPGQLLQAEGLHRAET